MKLAEESHIDVMLDIETFDTVPGAAIISIGAAVIGRPKALRHLERYSSMFMFEVNIDDAMANGSVSKDTLIWWLQCDAEAQKSTKRTKGGGTLKEGLVHLSDFLANLEQSSGLPVCVWGNGATFDITLLEAAYRACGITVPWKFWNVNDMRTLARLYQHLLPRVAPGTAHDAISDAVAQAKTCARWLELHRSILRAADNSVLAAMLNTCDGETDSVSDVAVDGATEA